MANRKSKIRKRSPRGKRTIRPQVRLKKKARAKRLAKAKPNHARRNAKTKTRARSSLRGHFSKPSKARSRTTGHASRIKVYSRILKKKTTIDRRETHFKTKDQIKFPLSKTRRLKAIKFLTAIAVKHYKAIGKSKSNLWLFKLRYHFKLDGKKFQSYFSNSIEKITKEKQIAVVIENLVDSLISRLDHYVGRGFSKITVNGIRVQGYK